MLLRATVKCSCGCTYEIVSDTPHDSISCPNCSKRFSESDKLIEILKIYDSINLKTQNPSSDAFENIFKHESLTLESISLAEEHKYLK